ncbi:succinate dehydrogenase cytochrome b558 subunit [Chengkuizengella marina]|uniref:Succinate dehydrogenase n=1 Tax=Chengkuizengella marina TaxID=2507566 RepID=A0A6N9Q119_9BACL|nr:succinate dehydrogenase cytochrome b558 subunit [Chengkuizengella marina]NBI28852.1 succinate dehydrogenase [Chengkuizengella marina]
MKLNSFYSRKLHSLLGVIPLGFFLLEHLLTNYEAFIAGKEGFIEQVIWLNGLPLVLFLEIFGIWLPLLYHGVYGLYIALQAKHNVGNYGYVRNHMFLWQRITGVITLIFVVWHFSDTRLQVALGNLRHEELATHMYGTLSSPYYFALYVIGIVATCFHFSNGMWSFLVSWGITVGPRAQRASAYIWMGVFVILSVLFILALTSFTDESFALSILDSAQIEIG